MHSTIDDAWDEVFRGTNGGGLVRWILPLVCVLRPEQSLGALLLGVANKHGGVEHPSELCSIQITLMRNRGLRCYCEYLLSCWKRHRTKKFIYGAARLDMQQKISLFNPKCHTTTDQSRSPSYSDSCPSVFIAAEWRCSVSLSWSSLRISHSSECSTDATRACTRWSYI